MLSSEKEALAAAEAAILEATALARPVAPRHCHAVEHAELGEGVCCRRRHRRAAESVAEAAVLEAAALARLVAPRCRSLVSDPMSE